MRTIAVLNQKGGVGKTTTVVNMAAALALKNLKVIVIDLDPQAHLTVHLGIDPSQAGNGSYEVLTKSAGVNDALINVRDNLWLLGANIDLVGAESELVSVVGRETILLEAIERIRDDYDYLIIDCPPSLGLLSLNALAACREVLIPIQPHFLALQGFGQLLQTISLVSKRINPGLTVTAILLCIFDSRVTLSAEVKADIEKFLHNARNTDCPWSNAEVIPIHIRRNVKLAEAPSYGKTIFEYEPKCHGSQDYKSIAEYLHGQMLRETEEKTLNQEALNEDKVPESEVRTGSSAQIQTKLPRPEQISGKTQSAIEQPAQSLTEVDETQAGEMAM